MHACCCEVLPGLCDVGHDIRAVPVISVLSAVLAMATPPAPAAPCRRTPLRTSPKFRASAPSAPTVAAAPADDVPMDMADAEWDDVWQGLGTTELDRHELAELTASLGARPRTPHLDLDADDVDELLGLGERPRVLCCDGRRLLLGDSTLADNGLKDGDMYVSGKVWAPGADHGTDSPLKKVKGVRTKRLLKEALTAPSPRFRSVIARCLSLRAEERGGSLGMVGVECDALNA